MPAAASFARYVSDYSALIDALRERSDQMELARVELDRISGLADGHSGKLLSKTPSKSLGLRSVGPVLETLGLILLVIEDPVARDKTLARRTAFDVRQRRLGNCNNSPKVASIESATIANPTQPPAVKAEAPGRSTEPISRAHLRVIQERPKRSAAGRR